MSALAKLGGLVLAPGVAGSIPAGGALGPLPAMGVTGAMTFTLEPAGRTTHVVMSYRAGGYSNAGFSQSAKTVDAVLGIRPNRLRQFLETGSPSSTSKER